MNVLQFTVFKDHDLAISRTGQQAILREPRCAGHINGVCLAEAKLSPIVIGTSQYSETICAHEHQQIGISRVADHLTLV